MSQTISPFDNFNAKYMAQEEVASTFVSNEDFFSIARNNHTFAIGPRGCGKTTMLKMLTTPAVRNWRPKTFREKELKENFPFIAIYIPSDDLWKDQLESITSSPKIDIELKEIIENALVTINILSNFCTGISKHIESIELKNKEQKEIAFSDLLIKYWQLNDCFSSINSVKNELIFRKKKFVQKIYKYVSVIKKDDEEPLDFEDYYFSDFLNDFKNAAVSYEGIYNEGKELKWALCFDELELISEFFCMNLLKKLRISPPNIVFKLSSGPLTDFVDSIAQVFHDYQIVKMWPNSIKEEDLYIKFCEEIAKERILYKREKKNIKKYVDIDFTKLLGNLDYEKLALKDYKFDINYSAKRGEAESVTWYAFKELAKKDFGLITELDKRGIDPENPIPRTTKNENEFIRKTKEIVINRLVFAKYKDRGVDELGRRSRKEYPIYYGRESIFKICEGNPRFIMNIIDELIIKNGRYKDIDVEYFSPKEQTEVIKNVSIRFSAMLKTFPTSTDFNGRNVDLSWLINEIGNYFEKEVNYKEFKINPHTSFKFKLKKTNHSIIELIEIGVRLGAFIKIDKNQDDISHNDEDSRYRLTYLLHPSYKLPLRLYGNVNLSTIIPNIVQGQLSFRNENKVVKK